MSVTDYAPNFPLNETACKGHFCCNHTSPEMKEIRKTLQALRSYAARELDDPRIRINSGFRCKVHNFEIGGAKESQHVLGTACDIQFLGCSYKQGFRILRRFQENPHNLKFTGIGLYPDRGFFHVDVRSGHPARWASIGGVYVPWEEAIEYIGDMP